MKRSIVLLIVMFSLCTGCGNNEQTDALKFKKEYEKYNDSKIELEIDDDNIVKYSNLDSINDIIASGTGVIFIGTPSDNLSRVAIEILLQAADSTDLDTIYYYDKVDDINGLEEVENLKVPVVINVLEGEIKSYKVGTVSDKTKLDEDEEMDLYNIYLEGIHEVLQDSCDERC